MRRNLSNLSEQTFDLLVVGGGIYGACAAWEAASRGLSVALVEKDDFGGATSANSLKTIHGGLRYLQHLDVRRMRESIAERSTLLRIGPHLVHPLPVLIPTGGHGLRGREIMSLALRLNDLVGHDRNRDLGEDKHLPDGRLLPRAEVQALLPGLPPATYNGAALFYDAQVYNSERLTLAFLGSAAQAGAQLANYAEACAFLSEGDRVTGVQVEDKLSGARFDVRARTVLNAAGPWVGQLLGRFGRLKLPAVYLARAVNLVTRQLIPTYAAGLRAGTGRDSRLLFISPWRGRSLIGTVYSAHGRQPDEEAHGDEVRRLIAGVNSAYPAAQLRPADVTFVHSGLLPAYEPRSEGGEPRLWRHYRIYDHRSDGVQGLISLLGVKYTTARGVAEKAIDAVFRAWGQTPARSRSAELPLQGGDIASISEYLAAQGVRHWGALARSEVERLVYNYGTAHEKVLAQLDPRPAQGSSPLEPAEVLKAEVRYAVREEMAVKLADVVLRRTEIASAGNPGEETMRLCAETMAAELGWGQADVERELAEATATMAVAMQSKRGERERLAA
ncbi:MAG: glycerol-3-phosphate dehydrogenase/oxidase [Chloroflexota bacterium]